MKSKILMLLCAMDGVWFCLYTPDPWGWIVGGIWFFLSGMVYGSKLTDETRRA